MLRSRIKTKWQGKYFIELLRENSSVMLEDFANLGVNILKSKVPVKTGRLRNSQVSSEEKRKGNTKTRIIGSDEDPVKGAYYAPFVFYPGITRNYAGNDWITPSMIELQRKIPQFIRQYSKKILKNKT